MFEKFRFYIDFQNISKNLDFAQNLQKLLILVKLFDIFQFIQIFIKRNTIFLHKFRKYWF